MHKLSILIPSLHSRAELLNTLLKSLQPQLTTKVEVLSDIDSGDVTIGEKRNRLLNKASGKYIVFIDDDDEIADTYVEDILVAIEYSPSVIGFIQKVSFNGNPFETRYLTTTLPHNPPRIQKPLHINPWRTEIAKQEQFALSNKGEDHCWANRMFRYIDYEIFIDKPMYIYKFVTPFNRKYDEDSNANRQVKVLKAMGIIK